MKFIMEIDKKIWGNELESKDIEFEEDVEDD